jgi:transcriptional regulator with XRE-family HTH domain
MRTSARRLVEAGPRTITGEQVSVARRLLGWSLMRLSSRCGVSDVTIQNFEMGRIRRPTPDVEAIRRALELGGVEFTLEQPGVRLRKSEK